MPIGYVHRYATSNTRSGVESCGILAGSLREKQGVFVISTLIIPKQEGTSDTVQALNEEEIFDVQDKRALYPLGWIHTHPTQTCFLSSVDVHTQCGYQVCHQLSNGAVTVCDDAPPTICVACCAWFVYVARSHQGMTAHPSPAWDRHLPLHG